MSLSQIKATEILLRKSVPDLMRAEVTGKDGGPLEHHHIDVPREETREEWLVRQQLEAAARSATGGNSSDVVH
jgi:hypothetical protein